MTKPDRKRRALGWHEDQARRARKATDEWQGAGTLPPLTPAAEHLQDPPGVITHLWIWMIRLTLWLGGLASLVAAGRALFDEQWGAAAAAVVLGVAFIALQRPLGD